MTVADLSQVAAIGQLAERGRRFVCWKNVIDQKTGKKRKVPFQISGEPASSTRPETWSTFDEAVENAQKKRKIDGIGFVFTGDGMGGVDLDGCRDPATGEISPWATEVIVDFASYAEVSPSGTGVKIIAAGAPAALASNKISMGTEPMFGGEHAPQIEVYVNGRYFTITGQHLESTPDEIVEAPEAWERLIYRLRAAAEAGKPSSTVCLDGLPELLRELLAGDDKLLAGWGSGEKLSGGKDASASGKDYSLVVHMARREQDNEQIELALRHYPHGQIGTGALAGRNADRRIGKLLEEADKIRSKAQRWRQSSAWFDELVTTEQGAIRDCIANGTIVLRADPAFTGRIWFDEHRQRVVCSDLPWRPGGAAREWTDGDDIRLAEWLQMREVPLSRATCADSVAAVADDNRVHPVREYLDGLAWDGVPRLDQWIFTYLGATVPEGEDRIAKQAYLREVGRRFPISAVARIYQPGCKVDTALILEGAQGAGKSQALAALAPAPEWFTDEISDLGTKDSAQDLAGKWLIEIAELSAMRRGDIERTKAFMSRSTDHYRPSYGRRSQDFPRQCVFAGTTNADAYLGDETGNRRFWPIKVGAIDVAAIARDRDQLWAEAVTAFKAGERWWLDDQVEKTAADEQAVRRIVDPWEHDVLEWAQRQTGLVTIADALATAVGVDLDKRDQMAANRIARIFRSHGWERAQRRLGNARVWHYVRPIEAPTPTADDIAAGASADAFVRASLSPPVPASPVATALTGDKNASNGAPVTSVTSVTSKFQTSGVGDHLNPGIANGLRGGGGYYSISMKTPVTTGATGDNTLDWRSLDGWRLRLRSTNSRDERVATIVAWGRAAGGTVETTNEFLRLKLPADLPPCLALVELTRFARDLDLMPKVVFGPEFGAAAPVQRMQS